MRFDDKKKISQFTSKVMHLVAPPLEPQACWMAWHEVEEHRVRRRTCCREPVHRASCCHDNSPVAASGSMLLKPAVQHTRNDWSYNLFFTLASLAKLLSAYPIVCRIRSRSEIKFFSGLKLHYREQFLKGKKMYFISWLSEPVLKHSS